jgi:5-methylcytosine-specific restriction endonuclease McrA
MSQFTHTLILPPWMTPPHRWAPWEKVMVELSTKKVEVLEEYPDVVYPEEMALAHGIPGWTGRMPAVVRLVKPIAMFKKGIKWSRINVYSRDSFSCQYCGRKFAMKDLNYDHVVPRIQGGKTDYLNVVTSCIPCNNKKGGRTPEQAGMKLLRQPFIPKTLPLTSPMTHIRVIPDIVRPYLEGTPFLNLAVG